MKCNISNLVSCIMATILYISLFVKTKFIKSTKKDKGESVSSATMQLVGGVVVQVCDVLSFFCNLSKSLQESKVFFCLVFLDDTTTIFVTLWFHCLSWLCLHTLFYTCTHLPLGTIVVCSKCLIANYLNWVLSKKSQVQSMHYQLCQNLLQLTWHPTSDTCKHQ